MSLVLSVDEARGALLGDEILSTGSGSEPNNERSKLVIALCQSYYVPSLRLF